jgi:hypothetical protein
LDATNLLDAMKMNWSETDTTIDGLAAAVGGTMFKPRPSPSPPPIRYDGFDDDDGVTATPASPAVAASGSSERASNWLNTVEYYSVMIKMSYALVAWDVPGKKVAVAEIVEAMPVSGYVSISI